MKNTGKSNKVKSSGIRTTVKKSLDQYATNVLFPEKLAKANKLLKNVRLPLFN